MRLARKQARHRGPIATIVGVGAWMSSLEIGVRSISCPSLLVTW